MTDALTEWITNYYPIDIYLDNSKPVKEEKTVAEKSAYVLVYKDYCGYFSVDTNNKNIVIQVSRDGTREYLRATDAYNAIDVFEKYVNDLVLKEEAEESYLKAASEALRSLIKIRKDQYKELDINGVDNG